MTTTTVGELAEGVATWNPQRHPARVFDYIDLSGVDNDAKAVISTTRTTGADAPSRARQIVATGDVLVSTVRPNLNAVAMVPASLDGATASTGFSVLRPLPGVEGRFLFHWVRSPAFVADMVRRATGASYPAVSDRIVRASTLPKVPINEQRRIAAILDQADALRTKRRLVLAHLDTLAQATFHDMFGDEPVNATVGGVAEIQGGLQVSHTRENLPVEVPYLRVANAHRGRLDLSEVKSLRATQLEIDRTRLSAGDLLFVEGHANPREIGRVAMWNGELTLCVHQNHLIRARFDRSQVLPEFATSWLNSERGSAHFRRLSNTTSGLNTISSSVVRSAPLLVPTMQRQRAFVDCLRATSDVRDRLSAVPIDEAFDSIQARAFSGQL